MRKPKAGDTVRIQTFMLGHFNGFTERKLEELHHCLGVYGEYGPRIPCNFTPLCEMVQASPGDDRLYYSNYGEYFGEYIQTYEIISND